MKASCIYTGQVRHRRFEPVRNTFRYRVFMMYLDLSELPDIFRGRWFWSVGSPNLATFRRADYLGPSDRTLDESVRTVVETQTGARPSGPIRMLTHLRYVGYCFNPVTFYYCFDEGGVAVETIVAQITNTPWGQRHTYVLPETGNTARAPRKRFEFEKQFHISPFMPMDMHYDWRFSAPGQRLNVHMNLQREGRKVLDATLTLNRREISGSALAATLVGHPPMTWKVVTMIHWQALRLWLKGATFYPNPAPPERARGDIP
jgi:DUF1365 family protein